MINCFIIVNYNDYKSTKHLVDNIIDYNIVDHIIIVDNASNSSERELLSTIKNKKIEILYEENNLGYSHAINVGSKYVIDKYKKANLIISNSDIVIMSEEDLIKLIDLLNYEKVGIVGPQILERGSILKGYKDISVNREILNYIPIANLFANDDIALYPDSYYIDDKSVVEVINSAFFLISSDTMKIINYMDENVFLYYEDYILSKKVRNNDLMVVVCNDVKIKHLYSVSVNKNYNNYKKTNLLNKSKYYYHTTFNDINLLQRHILKILLSIDLFFAKLFRK